MTTIIEESKYPDNITDLEVTDGIIRIETVNNFMSSFNSKSVIVLLNHKYQNKIIESPVILEDWKLTNESFDNLLKNKGVAEEDKIQLVRMLNHNAKRITDHFSQQTSERMHAGRRAKMERIERAKSSPPVEVTISDALKMHEGNIRVKGMISAGSDKIEKMITRVFFRCGECDAPNKLADYRESRPRFACRSAETDVTDATDTIDKGGIGINDATTDKIMATNSNHINEETRTSIMSNMSVTSTTEASHSRLEKPVYDQKAKFQEKPTEEIKNDTNGVYKNGHNGDADRPPTTTEKEILNVNHVNHVTSPQRGSTNPPYNAGNIVDADGRIMDIAGPSEKERQRCKQAESSLTDEQVNLFYQIFNELENASYLQPGSFSSDDKGTIGGEELRSHLVSVGKLNANDADWIVKEMQRIGNIRKVAFDTFKRAIP